MQIEFVIAYAVIYFVGYYGFHFMNLLFKRVLVKNLRIAALIVVAILALVHFVLLNLNAPTGVDPLVLRAYQIQISVGPAVIVAIAVFIKMWLENRKSGKPKKFGD